MEERGFRDCDECHGEGVVNRLAHDFEPPLEVSDIPVNEQAIWVRTEIVSCPECEKRRAAMKAADGRRPSPEERKDIPSLGQWLSANMAIGSRFYIDDYDWAKLCAPYNTPFGALMGEGPIDRLMGNLIGSSYGGWKVESDWRGGLHIERCKTGDKRTYASPDRRHLYTNIGGELVHKDNIYSARAVAEIARLVLSVERPT